jgi:hypothetical protein
MNHEAHEQRRQVMLQQGWISIREICAKLGYTPGAGLKWISSGALTGAKMHNSMYVPVEAAMKHFGKERWLQFGLPLPLGQ